jgi:hypothetical protein
MLTLPPARGVPVGLLLAEAWLRRGIVSFVAVAACGKGEARCLLLTTEAGAAPLDREHDPTWLAGVR